MQEGRRTYYATIFWKQETGTDNPVILKQEDADAGRATKPEIVHRLMDGELDKVGFLGGCVVSIRFRRKKVHIILRHPCTDHLDGGGLMKNALGALPR
jgi:hypothetical protein